MFEAGAHVDVHLPGGLIRQYSLCNPPEEHARYLIAVLREPGSRGGSVAMHDQVKEGDRLQISAPRNHFPLAREAKRSLLFAGGIGVTPIMCMAEQLAGLGSEFELHYCARSEGRMAFAERLRQSAFAKQVHLHLDEGAPEQRLNAAALLANPMRGTHLYVCGPTGFMDYIIGTAQTQGWENNRIHREYFGADPSALRGGAEFYIQLASTGEVFTIPEDKSVAEVLNEAGVHIPVSCEQGVCGTCLTHILKGEPEHRDLFMTDAEHAQNNQFTPCCSRAKTGSTLLLGI